MGKKLSTARFALSIVKNKSKADTPSEANEPATPMIPSGPDRFVGDSRSEASRCKMVSTCVN